MNHKLLAALKPTRIRVSLDGDTLHIDEKRYYHPELDKEVPLNKLPEKWQKIYSKRKEKVVKPVVSPETHPNLFTQSYDGEQFQLAAPPRNETSGGSAVKINPKFNASNQDSVHYATQKVKRMVGIKKDEVETTYLYTVDYIRKQKLGRFELVRQFIDAMDDATDKFQKDLKSKDELTRTCAFFCLASKEASFRIGSNSDAIRSGTKSYGLSTLLNRHCKLMMDSEGVEYFQFHYPSKSGVKLTKKVFSPELVAFIKKKWNPEEPMERIFLIDNKVKTTLSNEANKYLQSIVPLKNEDGKPITFHKFRHIKGTKVFMEAMDAIEDKYLSRLDLVTPKELERAINSAAEEAADAVGNTKGASLGNYIDPQVIFDRYRKYALEIPYEKYGVSDTAESSHYSPLKLVKSFEVNKEIENSKIYDDKLWKFYVGYNHDLDIRDKTTIVSKEVKDIIPDIPVELLDLVHLPEEREGLSMLNVKESVPSEEYWEQVKLRIQQNLQDIDDASSD